MEIEAGCGLWDSVQPGLHRNARLASITVLRAAQDETGFLVNRPPKGAKDEMKKIEKG